MEFTAQSTDLSLASVQTSWVTDFVGSDSVVAEEDLLIALPG